MEAGLTDILHDLELDLGFDRGGNKQVRVNEISTAVRLERWLGVSLERYADGGVADWYDPSTGKTYDAVGGGVPNEKLKIGDIIVSLDGHLARPGLDKIVLDYNGLNYHNANQLDRYYYSLPRPHRDRIIRLR